MSRDAAVTLDWGDGSHHFRMAFGDLVLLEEARATAACVILDRLRFGGWFAMDLREVIRIGLIGGGKPPVEALRLVRTYVEQRPLMESVSTALEILAAGMAGAPEEDVGESLAADQEAGSQAPFPTADSDPRPSTEPAVH